MAFRLHLGPAQPVGKGIKSLGVRPEGWVAPQRLEPTPRPGPAQTRGHSPKINVRDEDAKAEAYASLACAWWSTTQHKARRTFAKLHRINAFLRPDLLVGWTDKHATGYRLAEPPPEATRWLYKMEMIQ